MSDKVGYALVHTYATSMCYTVEGQASNHYHDQPAHHDSVVRHCDDSPWTRSVNKMVLYKKGWLSISICRTSSKQVNYKLAFCYCTLCLEFDPLNDIIENDVIGNDIVGNGKQPIVVNTQQLHLIVMWNLHQTSSGKFRYVRSLEFRIHVKDLYMYYKLLSLNINKWAQSEYGDGP